MQKDVEFTRISEPGTFAGLPTIEVDKMKFHLSTHLDRVVRRV